MALLRCIMFASLVVRLGASLDIPPAVIPVDNVLDPLLGQSQSVVSPPAAPIRPETLNQTTIADRPPEASSSQPQETKQTPTPPGPGLLADLASALPSLPIEHSVLANVIPQSSAAAQVTGSPTQTHDAILQNFITKFAALFAKVEHSVLSLDGPLTTPSPQNPLDQIIDSNPLLSGLFHPMVAVTESPGSADLEGPGQAAPIVGGAVPQSTSAPSVGGLIASALNGMKPTPGAQADDPLAKPTQTISLPGQLVNVAPNVPLGQAGSNKQIQDQGDGVSQAWIIGSQTVAPGGPAQVISGTTFSLAQGASSIYVNGVPYDVYSGTNAKVQDIPYILPGGTTVQPGGQAITLSGTTYSLAAHGSTLFVNGVPTVLPTPTIHKANQPTPFIIDGHTVLPGSGATVIDGQTYSLAAATAGGALYINGTKVADPQNFALLTMAFGALQSALSASSSLLPASTLVTTTSLSSPSQSDAASNANPSKAAAAAGIPGLPSVYQTSFLCGLVGMIVAVL